MSRLLPIVLIILSACLGYFYIYPLWSGDITTQQQQIASYNQALQAADQFNSEEKQLLAKSQSISQSDLDKLEDYMPNSVDNIQLILDLNTLANNNGLTLSGFSIQDNSDGSNADGTSDGSDSSGTATSSTSSQPLFSSSGATNSLDLSVNATGTYGDFLNFLSAAELSERPLDVTKLSITNSSSGVYTYGITFQIYWLAS